MKTRFKRLLVTAGVKDWGQRRSRTEVRLILSSIGSRPELPPEDAPE